MSSPVDRRARKRLAMRQSISDAATRLFFERGFDQVTVDDVAVAADVSRMTVFNHFPRKEDMFFDLDELGREDVRLALQQRDETANVSLVEILRLFAHGAVAERRPYTRFFEQSEKFFSTIESSETLKARARAIRDELTQTLTAALSQAAGRAVPDVEANLAATLIVATWGVAFVQAHRRFAETHEVNEAHATLLRIIDLGSSAARAALKDTPYE